MYSLYQETESGFALRWTQIVVATAGVLLLWQVGKTAYQLLSDPLEDLPGPTMAKFTRLWLLKQYAGGRFQEVNLDLHKQYGEFLCCWKPRWLYRNWPMVGPVVRIAPNQYSIDDPDAVKILYGLASKFVKAWVYFEWKGLYILTRATVRLVFTLGSSRFQKPLQQPRPEDACAESQTSFKCVFYVESFIVWMLRWWMRPSTEPTTLGICGCENRVQSGPLATVLRLRYDRKNNRKSLFSMLSMWDIAVDEI